MKPGTKHSHESIEKMRISKSGSNNPNFGKQRSVCTRKKISGALMGHVIDESTKNKISKSLSGPLNANFGNRTQEHNRKISLSQLGKPANQETISKSIETKLGGFWYGNVRYDHRRQYCEKWNANLRERVRAFFNYTCIECGAIQSESKLHVHHVHYNKKLCCDDTPRSLVVLCKSCHAKTNYNRKYWSSHFQEILDLKYSGKCWITKQEYKEKFYGDIQIRA
jgi:hypothetical protein